jgi:hypothetical protein
VGIYSWIPGLDRVVTFRRLLPMHELELVGPFVQAEGHLSVEPCHHLT